MALFGKERKAFDDALVSVTALADDLRGTNAKAAALLDTFVQMAGALFARVIGLAEKGEAVLDTTGDVAIDVHGIVEQLKAQDVPGHIIAAVEAIGAALAPVLDTVHRVALRGGNTLKGLFPLTCELKATPGSALAALLRDAEGKPGSLTVTITPAHIPG